MSNPDYTVEIWIGLIMLLLFFYEGEPNLKEALICNLTHTTECN